MKSTLIPAIPHFAYWSSAGTSLIVQCLPDHPQNDADVFLLRISRQLFHVDLGHDFQNVAELVPTFVQNDVIEMILRREVDVIFVRLRIDCQL